MNSPPEPNTDAPFWTNRDTNTRTATIKTLAAVGLIAAFVLWSHLGSGVPVFHSEVSSEPGWEKFRAEYRIDHFGHDGQFVRAVQNGYNLIFYTYKYAPRFTRRTAGERVNSCGGCHTAEDLAYSFVNSDRFDRKLGKRVSFEDRVQRCYAGPMDGFVPTVYDPAVRDIRIFARAVAHHLQLGEGSLRKGG
jgi:cytochrome c